MSQSPVEIAETVLAAKDAITALHDRVRDIGSIDDRAELSLIHTTVRMIEDLLAIAGQYGEVLHRQLARTNLRIKGHDA